MKKRIHSAYKGEIYGISFFTYFADHETAIYQCWKAEQNGEPGIGYLSTFIQKYT